MRWVSVLVALFFVVGSRVALAQPADKQLKDVQKQLDQQQQVIQELQQKLNSLEDKAQTIKGLENDFDDFRYQYLKSIREKVNVHLYGSLEFENFENTDSVFDARNIELEVGASASQRFHLFTEIEFERTAMTSKDERQGEVEVEQAWFQYDINRYINLRSGVISVPFGRFNLEHYDTLQDLTDRPLMARRVIPVTWAEAGAGFLGSAYLGGLSSGKWLQEFSISYELYAVNGLTDRFSDTSSRDAGGAFGKDNNNNKAVVGRLQISPIPALELGLSGYLGKYDREGNKIQGYDIDGKLVCGPAELVMEFANFDLDEGLNDESLAITQNLQGGYIEGRYHFWFAFLNETFMGRGLEDPTFTAVARAGYAEIEDDGDADEGDNREERLTLGLNYRPVEAFVFKLEYQFNNTDNEPLERGDDDGFIASISIAL